MGRSLKSIHEVFSFFDQFSSMIKIYMLYPRDHILSCFADVKMDNSELGLCLINLMVSLMAYQLVTYISNAL